MQLQLSVQPLLSQVLPACRSHEKKSEEEASSKETASLRRFRYVSLFSLHLLSQQTTGGKIFEKNNCIRGCGRTLEHSTCLESVVRAGGVISYEQPA